MMPHFLNNKRPAWVVGVKFTLIPLVVALLFLGMIAVADSVGNPTDRIVRDNAARDGDSRGSSLETRLSSFFSGDGNFLSSLRFWDRNKSQPQTERQAVPQAERQAAVENMSARPRETAAETRSPPSDTRNTTSERDTTSETPSETSASPLNPYAAHYSERRDGVLGNAPLPGQVVIAHNVRARDAAAAQGANSHGASFSSYSFDTRDWVEHFPLQEREEEVVYEEQAGEIQATSYRTPTTEAISFQLPPAQNHADVQWNAGERRNVSPPNTGNQWDGHATPLAASSMRVTPNTARAAPATPVAPVAAPSEKPTAARLMPEVPPLDLSPSYGQRLQHTQTCGVVVVQANFPLTEIASILEEINQLQYDLMHYIGVPAPREKIELCLFKDEASYTSFLQEHFPRAPRDRRALYVKLDNKPGTLLVQKSRHFEVDLRHEMTHAIVHASIPQVPIWLDEGLAKYFEVPIKDRAANHPYLPQVRRNARLGMVPSLDRLGKLETIDDMGAKEYQDSWAWVHFLIHRSPETHQLLAAYLQMLANWKPGERSQSNSEGTFRTIFERITTRQSSIPSLKIYLDDMIPNQREAFREHFGAMEK